MDGGSSSNCTSTTAPITDTTRPFPVAGSVAALAAACVLAHLLLPANIQASNFPLNHKNGGLLQAYIIYQKQISQSNSSIALVLTNGIQLKNSFATTIFATYYYPMTINSKSMRSAHVKSFGWEYVFTRAQSEWR